MRKSNDHVLVGLRDEKTKLFFLQLADPASPKSPESSMALLTEMARAAAICCGKCTFAMGTAILPM